MHKHLVGFGLITALALVAVNLAHADIGTVATASAANWAGPVVTVTVEAVDASIQAVNTEGQYRRGEISKDERELRHARTGAGAVGGISGAFAGTAAGGAVGAAIGSFFTPAGTVVGATVGGVIGGLVGGFGGYFGGKKVGETSAEYALR